MRLHDQFDVMLKCSKDEVLIPYGCGVRQGDDIAPLLFIFVMQIIIEEIGK